MFPVGGGLLNGDGWNELGGACEKVYGDETESGGGGATEKADCEAAETAPTPVVMGGGGTAPN